MRFQRAPLMRLSCRSCSECRDGSQGLHHWIENTSFEDDRDPEFICQHCPACCNSVERDDGATVPDEIVRVVVKGALSEAKVDALRRAMEIVQGEITAIRLHDPTALIDPVTVLAVDTLRRLLEGDPC